MYSLALAHKGNGDIASAVQVYDIVIEQYYVAMEGKNHDLLWQYREPQFDLFLDVFDDGHRSPLPRAVIWSALGEVYNAKGNAT